MIILLFFQLKQNSSQFNLYKINKGQFDSNCLYFDHNSIFYDHRILIEFCIRSERLNDQLNICNGKIIEFKELKLINVSIYDLFQWNIPIEIIDLYSKYIYSSNQINDNEYICNCSSLSQFGKYCEYQFKNYDDQRSFTELFETKDELFLTNEYLTYFIGIQCQTNLISLDWRQICNGIVDCDSGEDEPTDLCLSMELNQCHSEKEFRCKNGLCIPILFSFDLYEDCQDQTDETNKYTIDLKIYRLNECSMSTSFHCDETNDAWKRFSCGNEQVIYYSDLTSKLNIQGKTCENERHLQYLTKMFNSNNEDQCWKSMICLTEFNYLYPNIDCSDEINIEKSCPNQFYFPPNSVVYSFVYFLYENINLRNWSNYTGPNYICYERKYCQKHIFKFEILKSNLTCFNVDQKLFSWENFVEYIIYLFNPCFNSSILMNNNMYKCYLSNTVISTNRIKDKIKDCFFNEDEDPNINLCSFNLTNIFKCITNSNECIRQSSIGDNEYDCQDGSDEFIRNQNTYCVHRKCSMDIKINNYALIYTFYELCDNIINTKLFSIQSNETDETDCEYWPLKCDKSPYTLCNRIWNCKNGIDELNCPITNSADNIRNSFSCNDDEHYCIQLLNLTCIHINKCGDGIIDCIGGTDERLTYICEEKYPNDYKKRFLCLNSSQCIEPKQVCNKIIDCPQGDDELICPWLIQSDSSKFHCNNSLLPIDRCDLDSSDYLDCQLYEQFWFCDLEHGSLSSSRGIPINYVEYPKIGRKIKSNNNNWLCNKGYPIESSILNRKSYCLCPPSYYGDYCQYQSERLTVIIKIQFQYNINPLTVFRLIIYLLNENNETISYDEIVYNYHKQLNLGDKYLVYLMYERLINVSLYERLKSKYVRIDSYIIRETNLKYISSWLYPVLFPFLPVNRLVVLIELEDESFEIWKCKKNCGLHGKCMYYINSLDEEYCRCSQNWKGEFCHLKSSLNLCNKTSCHPNSECVVINDKKEEIKCVCPLGKSGNQCYITYNSCYYVQCRNNGTCLPLDQRNFDYVCICQDDYTGIHCEKKKKISYISISGNISNDLSQIPVIVAIFSDQLGDLLTGGKPHMYRNIPLGDTLKMSGDESIRFAVIRIYYNVSFNVYYLILMRQLQIDQINTSVIPENYCPNISEIFNKTILNEYSYLKRLKLYHLPCQENKDLKCFYDEYRMCFCTKEHYSDCRRFYHQWNDCNYCTNDGLCISENPFEERWNFVCLCSECSFGHRCQFISGNYFLTFDMLIGLEIIKDDISFNQQPLIIYFTLIIIILIFIIGFILNILCIIIFSNKKLRQVGCDLYLLYLTITSQIGLILLFLRYLFLIIIQINRIEDDLFIQISCIFLEYSLRLIPSVFDWLTVCISIERTYIIIKDIQFTKIVALKTLKLSRWIILGVFLMNILTTLHRPFYLILIDDDAQTLTSRKPGHPWCILDFQSTSWIIYEKSINIIHLVLPLIFNLFSIILFLFKKVKSELKTTIRKDGKSQLQILKEQLLKYKPLLIGTFAIIILEIPRFILTFVLACIKHTWQRYLYLFAYLISFLPLTGILFIYVIPSLKYKQQLKNMKIKFHKSISKNQRT